MKRVECDLCKEFIDIVLQDESNFLSKTKAKAKCKIGKRVMFRQPKFNSSTKQVPYNDFGYIRFCNDFKEKT